MLKTDAKGVCQMFFIGSNYFSLRRQEDRDWLEGNTRQDLGGDGNVVSLDLNAVYMSVFVKTYQPK